MRIRQALKEAAEMMCFMLVLIIVVAVIGTVIALAGYVHPLLGFLAALLSLFGVCFTMSFLDY